VIVGPLQFDSPHWLLLIPILGLIAWWMARRNLSGLSRKMRLVSLGVRIGVIILLSAALAEPRWRTEGDAVAVTVVMDVSDSMPRDSLDAARAYVGRSLEEKRPEDQLGVVTAAGDAFVQALPSRATRSVEIQYAGPRASTDLASGVRLAMAVKPEASAGRILLVTDGNETSGSLLAAAESAEAAGVPIDVLPIDYTFDREIIFDRLIAPATARRGEPVNLRFVIESTAETQARVTLLSNDAPIDLDPGSEGVSAIVDLDVGTNVTPVPVTLSRSGTQRFRAVVEPLDESDDSIVENNNALAVTFVSGEGRLLVYTEDAGAYDPLMSALRSAGLEIEVRSPRNGHDSLIDLGAYDGIVLANVSAYSLSRKRSEERRVGKECRSRWLTQGRLGRAASPSRA